MLRLRHSNARENRMLKPARGTALRIHVVATRFAGLGHGGRRPGSSMLDGQVIEIRRLLRTDLSLREIALHLGTNERTLRMFIKRRQICDLRARRDFRNLQRSVARVR